jgi:hypothetical protein
MCLNVSKDKAQMLVADKDIPVFKIVHTHNTSMCQGFAYKPNTLYELDQPLRFHESVWDNKVSIHRGFHSYDSLDTGYKRHLMFHTKLVAFFIPAGAVYVIGDNGEIASTAIRSGDLVALNQHLDTREDVSGYVNRLFFTHAWGHIKKAALAGEFSDLMRLVSLGFSRTELLDDAALQNMKTICMWQKDHGKPVWNATKWTLDKIAVLEAKHVSAH